MGTRADFYVGFGPESEWLGSIAWDGYEWAQNKDSAIASAKTADEFRAAVAAELASRDDATLPEQGWPWPWDDSTTTDYAYCFEDDRVVAFIFGRPVSAGEEEEGQEFPKRSGWKDMSAVKKFTMGKRSGILVFGA